ncbi:MFS transporter [Vibrio sp.]|uniref:MFS transporter n=1 Tax=Vibrio viridaestus TaxID=2487322 RepID=A0A3N9TJA6_9VIBR|nr:MFS transporter [Vibrio viridaestus]MDC0611342.1 MFS transporter [Vibrio sp.]RQW64250.1 MFS transporter [Vibrio viridaestus]
MSRSINSLLKKRRFLPYFSTQFFGAFNDNIFKNTLLLFVAFAQTDELAISSSLFINLAAGLFILPFFLFSATAGVLADKLEKSALIRKIKLLEIVIMICGAVGFLTNSYVILLILLFLMGTQSAFFGPVKYALLPQHLKSKELVAGNALVEMGTFIAILLGTLTAGFIASAEHSRIIAAGCVIVFALAGYVSSRSIPHAEAGDPNITFRFQPWKQTRQTLSISKQDKVIQTTLFIISWFWFLGATYLTQFPNFTKISLLGNEAAVSWLLALFSVGIAVGSLLCDRISFGRIEIGVVTLSSLGLSLFGYLLIESIPQDVTPNTGFISFISNSTLWPLFSYILMIGVCGGLFIVPLYTLLQKRAKPAQRAQVIAALNIYNSLFMVGSAILGIVCLSVLEMSIPELFQLLAILNLIVFIYLMRKTPVYTLRVVLNLLLRIMYRIRFKGTVNIPESGPALIVCNHVSYLDALLLNIASPRLIRFVMEADYANFVLIRRLMRSAGVIPICADDAKMVKHAFSEVGKALEKGDLVCIFPEGKLTPDGSLQPFLRGVDIILRKNPVPVIPVGLLGVWGCYFSRSNGKACKGLPRFKRHPLFINVGEAVPSEQADRKILKEKVAELLAEKTL